MNEHNFETEAIRLQLERSQFQEHTTPMYITSSFVFEDAEDMRASFSEEKERNIYSRFSNPNTTEFVEKGDHIVSARSVFGSTHTLFTKYFPKWNIETSYFDIKKPAEIEDLIKPSTKILYAESPTNPGVDIIDLEFLGVIAKKYNLLLIIDNCFATPYIQQPIKFGADLVVHSATKLMDGQGRVLGGVVVGKSDLVREIYLFSRNTGPAMSPFNAWILSKSLETLAVRVDKHCENALKIAVFLENNPKVNTVKYPFLKSHPQYKIAKKQMKLGGNIIAIDIKGGIEAGRDFLNAIKICSLSANLGDTRTIVTHPASTTHSKLTIEEQFSAGIFPGLVRISVGLEHVNDIIEDINQALNS